MNAAGVVAIVLVGFPVIGVALNWVLDVRDRRRP